MPKKLKPGQHIFLINCAPVTRTCLDCGSEVLCKVLPGYSRYTIESQIGKLYIVANNTNGIRAVTASEIYTDEVAVQSAATKAAALANKRRHIWKSN